MLLSCTVLPCSRAYCLSVLQCPSLAGFNWAGLAQPGLCPHVLLALPSSLPDACRLIKLLDIDLNWRLNRVSDGQRRRVQIAMGLLKPYEVCWVAATGWMHSPLACTWWAPRHTSGGRHVLRVVGATSEDDQSAHAMPSPHQPPTWPQVLLLDEITVDMDVVGRLDLLAFFKQECQERGATIVYVSRAELARGDGWRCAWCAGALQWAGG